MEPLIIGAVFCVSTLALASFDWTVFMVVLNRGAISFRRVLAVDFISLIVFGAYCVLRAFASGSHPEPIAFFAQAGLAWAITRAVALMIVLMRPAVPVSWLRRSLAAAALLAFTLSPFLLQLVAVRDLAKR